MRYYKDSKQALSDLINDLENDNGILLIAKEDVESELEYANKCHSLEEKIDCPLEEIFEFVKLLKKYYYVDITGQLQARNVWDNKNLNENELYKINHIFNDIKNEDE